MKALRIMMLLAVLLTPVLAACQPETVEVTRVVKETVVETVVEEKEVEVEVEVTREVEVEVVEEKEVEVTRIVEVEVEPAEVIEFVFAHPGPIRTMDAPVTYYGTTHWLTNLLYDALIWRKADGSGYVGQAAESWEVIDPLTWRFHLREGLTFQNGEPLDANAVKWNIDRVTSRTDFMVYGQWQFVKEVQVVDDVTVDVLTHKPEAYLEFFISYNGAELLPPKYMEEVGEEEFAKHPVGSGPYKLVEFLESERYVFEAWDDYWDGRPDVDRVIYQVIPEASSQVAALLAGQVDMMGNVPFPDREKVSEAEGIVTMVETAGRGHELRLRPDLESGTYLETYPDYEPSTLDKLIRQAINHALDRNLLSEVQGTAYPKLVRGSMYAPEVTTYADKLIGPEVADEMYDLELAKQLIKEAGYDPDAGNKPMVYLDSPAFYLSNEKEVAETIAAMLEEAGFEVEMTIWDRSAFNEQYEGPGNNREAHLFTGGTNVQLLPLFYHCDWYDPTYHLCDPEWSAISDQILAEMDSEKRVELWGPWWDFYVDEAVNLGVYEIMNYYAINEKFEWKPRPDGWMTFRDLKLRE